jgi:hypothetical protein
MAISYCLTFGANVILHVVDTEWFLFKTNCNEMQMSRPGFQCYKGGYITASKIVSAVSTGKILPCTSRGQGEKFACIIDNCVMSCYCKHVRSALVILLHSAGVLSDSRLKASRGVEKRRSRFETHGRLFR